ncbi:MAG: hypothetical protein ACREJ3_17590 [Polyangiaceae bacterium]
MSDASLPEPVPEPLEPELDPLLLEPLDPDPDPLLELPPPSELVASLPESGEPASTGLDEEQPASMQAPSIRDMKIIAIGFVITLSRARSPLCLNLP